MAEKTIVNFSSFQQYLDWQSFWRDCPRQQQNCTCLAYLCHYITDRIISTRHSTHGNQGKCSTVAVAGFLKRNFGNLSTAFRKNHFTIFFSDIFFWSREAAGWIQTLLLTISNRVLCHCTNFANVHEPFKIKFVVLMLLEKIYLEDLQKV